MIVCRKLPEFRGDRGPYTWIWRITANLCLKAKTRLHARRVRHADEELATLIAQGKRPSSGDLEAWQADPEKTLFYQELVAQVRRECHFFILGLLMPEQRIAAP
jgi:DNA-directed RNA polymerase specialized sigma24 family protein